MSSNIRVQRICEYCGKEFTARKTVTKHCSDACSKKAYKVRKAKLTASKLLENREFLTVKEVARLLNCSVRSVYYYIGAGKIKGVNLGQRITRVRRSDIDKLFEQPQTEFDISECYTIGEVQKKFGISETALQNLIKRENIPKIKKGWYVYVPKIVIDNLLN